MAKERIHLYLSQEMIHAIQTLTQRPGEVSATAEELLQLGLSLKKGEVIEQRSLPVIREIVDTAMNRLEAELREAIHEDMKRDIQTMKADIIKEMKAREQKSDDRLAALIVRAVREGGISRRMLFTVLSKENPDLALAAYEDAKAKVGKELASRVNDEAA